MSEWKMNGWMNIEWIEEYWMNKWILNEFMNWMNWWILNELMIIEWIAWILYELMKIEWIDEYWIWINYQLKDKCWSRQVRKYILTERWMNE